MTCPTCGHKDGHDGRCWEGEFEIFEFNQLQGVHGEVRDKIKSFIRQVREEAVKEFVKKFNQSGMDKVDLI